MVGSPLPSGKRVEKPNVANLAVVILLEGSSWISNWFVNGSHRECNRDYFFYSSGDRTKVVKCSL